MRRSYFSLQQVIDLQCHLVVFGQVVKLLELVEPVIKHAGRNPSVPLVIGCDDFVQHQVHSIVHFGTHEDQRVPVNSVA